MEELLRSHLTILAELMQAEAGISATTIGKRALNDNTFFSRLENRNMTFQVRTYDRVIAWVSDHWPSRVPWPAEVPRPAPVEATS